LILQDLVHAINNLDSKVNAIADSIVPMHDKMQEVMAQHAFDKDLISHLFTVCSKDLTNLEMGAYCKYIEGMTALGKNKNIQEVDTFIESMDKIKKIVPDEFVKDMQSRNVQIEKWQKIMDEKATESRLSYLKLRDQVSKFHENIDTCKKDMDSMKDKMAKDTLEIKDELKGELEEVLAGVQSHAEEHLASLSAKCYEELKGNKQDVLDVLSEKKQELVDAMRDLENGKDDLAKLVKQAGEGIIEARRQVALHSNNKPRSGRGRN